MYLGASHGGFQRQQKDGPELVGAVSGEQSFNLGGAQTAVTPGWELGLAHHLQRVAQVLHAPFLPGDIEDVGQNGHFAYDRSGLGLL